MAAYAGSSLDVRWIQAAATTVITGDFQNFNYTPSINLYEQTAGADAAASYVPGYTNGQCSFSGVMQAAGTLITTVLAEGNVGTLKVSPEGTATTKQLITIPAISNGVTFDIPFNNVVSISVSWQQNGARVDGTN